MLHRVLERDDGGGIVMHTSARWELGLLQQRSQEGRAQGVGPAPLWIDTYGSDMNDREAGPVLFARAVLAFLLLPGVVAGLVPWLLVRPLERSFLSAGLIPLAAGVMVLLWCVRDFYVAGKGTLAPWDPPKNLVVVGLYRFSRNPMYIGVLLILAGWAIGYRSWVVVAYTGIGAAIVHLRVVLWEEPTLARLHGEEWSRYKANVPRWVPRIG